MFLNSTHVGYLDRAELEYELRVRGKTKVTGQRMENLRSILRKLLNKERFGEANLPSRDGDEEEVEICEQKLKDISGMINVLALPSPETDIDKLRRKLESLIHHTYLRIGRLRDDYKVEQLKLRKEIEEIILKYESLAHLSLMDKTNEENKSDSCQKKVLESDEAYEEETTSLKQNRRSKKMKKKSRRQRSLSSSLSDESSASGDSSKKVKFKTTPVRLWNLKFSGDDNTSVGAFLADIEDRRVANHMSFRELFHAAGELLSGSALIVYRSCRGRIDNWQDLEVKLRSAFQDPDYDRRLIREIENRKQGQEETVTVFIAKMRSLFSRLTKPKTEDDMLEIIEENVLPDYQASLSLQNYRNVDELETILLRLEKGRLRAQRYEARPNRNLLEPDLAYKPKLRRENVKISSMKSTRPTKLKTNSKRPDNYKSSAITCWNCKQGGHVFADCRKPRTIFCYGCGKEGTIKSKCSSCKFGSAKAQSENFPAECQQSGLHSAQEKSKTD